MENSITGRLFSQTMLRRLAAYLLGNFITALGVIVSVKSSLGVTPVQSIPYVVSRIFSIDQGVVTIGVYAFYVMLQVALLRRAFNPSGFLQVLIAILFGSFVAICDRLVTFATPEAYYVRLSLSGTGVVLIALGLLFYLEAGLTPQPAEGLVLVLAQLTGRQVHNVKIVSDCVMVAMAAFLSFAATGDVMGVREGTFIAMISVGKVFGLFRKLWQDKVRAFCFCE